MQYEVNSSVPLSRLFSVAEASIAEKLPIENYSISQNTLDNVFVGFVKHQGEIKKQKEAADLSTNNITTDDPLDDTMVFAGEAELRNLHTESGTTGSEGAEGPVFAFLDRDEVQV